MERRSFIAIVGGGGMGLLLPYAFYRYLSGGIQSRIGVKDYLPSGATGHHSITVNVS